MLSTEDALKRCAAQVLACMTHQGAGMPAAVAVPGLGPSGG
ncbi:MULTISPECIES: hypothetical protein [unclassified Pseudomonas]|nr:MULTISPECIES: hypothetical protein [unclassified Pseudomonas]